MTTQTFGTMTRNYIMVSTKKEEARCHTLSFGTVLILAPPPTPLLPLLLLETGRYTAPHPLTYIDSDLGVLNEA